MPSRIVRYDYDWLVSGWLKIRNVLENLNWTIQLFIIVFQNDEKIIV